MTKKHPLRQKNQHGLGHDNLCGGLGPYIRREASSPPLPAALSRSAEDADMDALFSRFDREIVMSLQWAKMSKGAQALLVALTRYADSSGNCWPSQRTLALSAGLKERTLRRNLRELEGMGLVRTQYRWSRNQGRPVRKNLYHVHLAKRGSNRVVPLPHDLVKRGYWATLSAPAKAMYIALVAMGGRPDLTKDEYKRRDYDICEIETEDLLELTGLKRGDIIQGRTELEHVAGLIKRDPDDPCRYMISTKPFPSVTTGPAFPSPEPRPESFGR